jgi:hypothetical protein
MGAKVIQIGAGLQQALQQLQRPAAPTPPPMVVANRAPRVYSPDLVPAGLPPAVQSAALLLCNPEARPVRALDTDTLTGELFQPVEMVPFLLGHSQTLLAGKDLFVMATAVAEMVQRDFPALTLPEVAAAMRRGCSGEWKKEKDLLLAALPSIRSWLKAYTTGSRAQALQALQLAEQQQQQVHLLSLPARLPELDYPQQIAAGMARMKRAGRLQQLDYTGVYYAWLKKIGAFAGFGDARRMMIKECWLLVRHRRLDEAQRSFKAELRKGWPAGHPLADTVLLACKKRLLGEWIHYHNARGTDMQTWLQQLAHRAAAAPSTPLS